MKAKGERRRVECFALLPLVMLCGCATERVPDFHYFIEASAAQKAVAPCTVASPPDIVFVGNHKFQYLVITNVVEEVHYKIIPVDGRDDRSILLASLSGAMMGWKWSRWDADWPDVSNNVYQSWAYVYAPSNAPNVPGYLKSP